jgi:hypothetical protein
MRLRSSTGVLAALLAAVLAPGVAQAHTVLLDPPPRDPNQIKVFPCGGAGPIAAGSAQRTVFQAGSTITVQFNEFVQHPGYFRIAFSDNGLDGFDDHVLVPMIADTNGSNYTVQVPLPSTPCDNCSIQLIQCMDATLPPVSSCSNYYSCADVILQGPAGPGAPDAGPPPAPGTPDADVPPGTDPGGDPQAGSSSGAVSGACTIAAGGTGSGSRGLVWVLLPLFVALPRLARRGKS